MWKTPRSVCFDAGRRNRLRRSLRYGACVILLAWLAPVLGAGADARIVTLKSGRTYRVEGEILVPVEAPPGPLGALNGVRWPGALLYYSFDSSVSAAQQTDFREWAAQWQAGSGVIMVEDSGMSNRVLVQIAADIGCGHSSIGMIGGVQDLVIASDPNCWASGVVEHELGHALGAVHEQQRTDRDAYVTITDHGIVDHCGQGTWDSNYGEVATDTATAYDYASIMHYPSPAHYTCGGVDVWADITVLRAEPAGDPAGSVNVCTTVADCQAILGSPTISARDRYGMALRYGYRIAIARGGNGSGVVVVSGFLETCGFDCYLASPASVLSVDAFPDADSIATLSGACHGQTSCQFSPNANGTVQVRFVRRASIAAIPAIVSQPKADKLFADGFDET